MTKNVRSWHGLTIGDNEVIFRGSAAQATKFRNLCHEFVRAHYETEHNDCFRNMKRPRQYGGCTNRGKWKRLLKEKFSLRRGSDGSIFIVHRADGDEAQVYSPNPG